MGTYLGIRKKTQSELEIAYMSQLAKNAERIESLEKRNDDHWLEIRKVVKEERDSCSKRIEEIEERFNEQLQVVRDTLQEQSEVLPPA